MLKDTNNLFNIKAFNGWEGEKVLKNVGERKRIKNGEYITVYKDYYFRKYPSYTESIEDLLDFLKTNPRYVDVFNKEHAGNTKAVITAIKSAGYATDEKYVSKIMRTVNGPTIKAAISKLPSLDTLKAAIVEMIKPELEYKFGYPNTSGTLNVTASNLASVLGGWVTGVYYRGCKIGEITKDNLELDLRFKFDYSYEPESDSIRIDYTCPGGSTHSAHWMIESECFVDSPTGGTATAE